MVWQGVSYDGVTDLVVCQKGVKTGAKVLEPLIILLSSTFFKNESWTFQQELTTIQVHKAKFTRIWLDFISTLNWNSGSTDLNALESRLLFFWIALFVVKGLKIFCSSKCLLRKLLLSFHLTPFLLQQMIIHVDKWIFF